MSPAAFTIQAVANALPAEAPIGGVMWSVVVPALLLAIASGGTYLLYRRFAAEDTRDRS